MESKTKKHKRRLQGVVVSDKMQKTVVVNIDRLKTHPKYHKQYRVSKKYKVHDEKNNYHQGDIVIIEETKPLSKEKRWRVIKKI
jgi:small subunit ribosomal protein S17